MTERLELDTLVELRDQYSDVYPLSPCGARGWIRGRREMPRLDPEVFIEWDKSHWRYYGEHDGWTFEHHFRPVNDLVPTKLEEPDKLHEILKEAQQRVDTERCSHCGELHNEQEVFLHTLMAAQEVALASDGYLILTLTPEIHDDFVVYAPQMYCESMSETAKKMLETQIVDLAAQILQRDVFDRVEEIEESSE